MIVYRIIYKFSNISQKEKGVLTPFMVDALWLCHLEPLLAAVGGDNVVWFCPPVGSTAGAVALVCGADSIGLFSTVPQADSDTSIAKLIKQAKTFRFIPSLFSSVLTLAWLEMEEFMQKSKAKCALLFLLCVFSAAFFIFFPASTGTWCISVNLMANSLLAQMILLCDLLTLFL